MITKIMDKKEIPHVYRHQDYSFLEDLENSELFELIKLCIGFVEDGVSDRQIIDELKRKQDCLSKVVCRLYTDHNIKGFRECEAELAGTSLEESRSTEAVSSLFLADVIHYDAAFKEDMTNDESDWVCALENTCYEHYGLFPLKIDLNHSDQEIIEQFVYRLRSLRERFEIPDSPRLYKQRKGDRDKIFRYKIVQLLDLMMWEKLEETQIKKSVLMAFLFPEGRYGEKEYYNTIMPFVNKLSNKSYYIL